MRIIDSFGPAERPASVTRRPIAVDLFSGAGGLSLGLEQAGFDVVAAVEYDPVHAATHLFNFPDTIMLCRDVSKLSSSTVLEAAISGYLRHHPDGVWPGTIDAIVGGPPCQGFSSGGKRDPTDVRNNLVLEFVRIVEELRPQTFCLENVSGLLGSKFEPLRSEAVRRLAAAGYSISGSETTVNALDFGVPQSRKRVIMLGVLEGEAPTLRPSSQARRTVGEAFEGLPEISRYAELLSSDSCLMNQDDHKRWSGVKGDYAGRLSGNVPDPMDLSRKRIWSSEHITNSRRTLHTVQTRERFSETLQGQVEPSSRLFRLTESGAARTLRAGSGSERGAHTSPRPIHPTENRAITVREAARLHGYPDWFRFHTTNWHGHRQVGNSVPPPLARAAGTALVSHLGLSPELVEVPWALGELSLLQLSKSQALPVVDGVESEAPASRVRASAIIASRQ